jgi:hypothetical protein
VKISKPKDEVLREAVNLLSSNGVKHEILDDSGSFSGDGFSGSFRLGDDYVEIEITKKPMLVPWLAVESKIKSYFS